MKLSNKIVTSALFHLITQEFQMTEISVESDNEQ
jgi:hypothetical protein